MKDQKQDTTTIQEKLSNSFSNYCILPINKLVKAKWNYKNDDEEKKQKLKNNILKNGQIENIIVRELGDKYEVVNGNHRLDVLLELKKKKVFCYNLGKISTAQAKKIAIETNETKFENDLLKLADLFSDISKEFSITELAETMPFTEKELQNFLELKNFEWPDNELEDDIEYGEYTKIIKIEVSKETYQLWKEWCNKCKAILGYDSDSKCFEFAIAEAMNIPDESLK